MFPPTEEQRRAWIAQWRSAAIELAQVRQSELVNADLHRIALDLEEACLESIRLEGLSPTSGLVEQQRLFHKAAKRAESVIGVYPGRDKARFTMEPPGA